MDDDLDFRDLRKGSGQRKLFNSLDKNIHENKIILLSARQSDERTHPEKSKLGFSDSESESGGENNDRLHLFFTQLLLVRGKGGGGIGCCSEKKEDLVGGQLLVMMARGLRRRRVYMSL